MGRFLSALRRRALSVGGIQKRKRLQRLLQIEVCEPRLMFTVAPVAYDDPTYFTPVSTTLVANGGAGGSSVSLNDVDLDGGTITASLVDNPSHGTLSSFNSDGTFTYVPNTGYSGFDTFTINFPTVLMTAISPR